MSQTSTSAAASSRFQAIFQAAVKSYQKQTKKDLIAHPLASKLQSCDSTAAILDILQDQVREFDKSHSGDERLTKWMGPTVNVLVAFSATVFGGVGLVFSPANVIFAGIGVFISPKMLQLDTYTKVAPTRAMTDIITEILVEVLKIFGFATKELRQGSAKKFLRKLAGMADLESALKKLDQLTQQEARMALAEVLKLTHNICYEVEDIGDEVEDIGAKVDDIGDKVQCLDKKVQVIINDGKQVRVETQEAKLIIRQTANVRDEGTS
ncbi:hypothetical protein EI94DRAFT_603363 [Lactarius quietus]|nr:hypothetical protein EI94DRAFT_603363 [Lactarius quietus]